MALVPYLSTLMGVAAGGSIGALARYGLVLLGEKLGTPAWGSILAVNLLGCAAMGALMAYVHRHPSQLPVWLSPTVQTAVGVGLLGAFTTFSTFAADMARLIETSQYGLLMGYMVLSVFGGLLCLVLAYRWVLGG